MFILLFITIYADESLSDLSKNRLHHYQKSINSYQNLPQSKQLIKVNLYLNQLLPQYDNVIQKKEDHWATPKEFLRYGFGDCEDYAIIKYFTLLELGFDEERLFLTTVRDEFSGGYHMVLSYFKNLGTSPLILDNLSFKILSLQERDDLQADQFINYSGVYHLDKDNKLTKIKNESIKFTNLLIRINNN